jgi:hypothetical protein
MSFSVTPPGVEFLNAGQGLAIRQFFGCDFFQEVSFSLTDVTKTDSKISVLKH